MSKKTYATISAAIFLTVALAHLVRIIFGWDVQIGGLPIPMWVSWLALFVAAALAHFGFRQRLRPH